MEENADLSLNGSDPIKIENGLQEIKNEAQKSPISKLGIVLDMDYKQPLEWFEIINNAIGKIFPETHQNKIERINSFVTISSDEILDIQLAYYLVNVNSKGELETLLRAIKSHPSPYADCLESWQKCEKDVLTNQLVKSSLTSFGLTIIYSMILVLIKSKIMLVISTSMAKFEYVMNNKQHIWNFEHSALNELKEFLKLFD